jgi:hypothetical protein
MLAKAERTERLTREIQAAKLELAQIRARHPEPRLTLDEASKFCDDQMEQFIALSETKDELAAQAATARERADKEETKMRSLREELMKKEREVDKAKAKQMAGEAPLLPDRYVQILTPCSCGTDFDNIGRACIHESWCRHRFACLSHFCSAGWRATRSFSKRTPGYLPYTRRRTTKCDSSSVLQASERP